MAVNPLYKKINHSCFLGENFVIDCNIIEKTFEVNNMIVFQCQHFFLSEHVIWKVVEKWFLFLQIDEKVLENIPLEKNQGAQIQWNESADIAMRFKSASFVSLGKSAFDIKEWLWPIVHQEMWMKNREM